ncbi:MAG TPA: protein kinase [Gemmataceae bacterium]|nr:protein kinase [Gemmataceae bacterium]
MDPAPTDTADARTTDLPAGGDPAACRGPQPGDVVGDYRLAAVLGAGGMGRVFRATDAVLGRDVAVKVVRVEVAVRPGARERFLREARAMAAVQHDHVVPIHAVGEADGLPFLVMPLLAGESLEARLARERPLAPAEVARIGREMAAGLAAAHAAGLVHRDVKPANVWLEAPGGRVKLLDFGLARDPEPAGAVTTDGAVVGSPPYMSPEQADGSPLDFRTDLFSLGTVLYECATGERPFRGPTLTATLLAVARAAAPPAKAVNPLVPAGLSDLIARLHARAPADRPPSAATVAADLAPFTVSADVQSVPLPPLVKRRKTSRLAWALVLLGLAVLVIDLAAPSFRKQPGAVFQDVGPPVPVAAPAPLSVALDIRVWKANDLSRGRALGDPGVLPLAAGDYTRTEVSATRPAYLYVIYLEAGGEAAPVYPWRGYHWDDRAPEAKRDKLHIPEDPTKDGAPLSPGPAGVEAYVVLARDEPLTADENAALRKLFAGATKGEFDRLRGAVWIGADRETRFLVSQDRGRPDLDKTGSVTDPVERVRRLLRTDVKPLAADAAAVCYPFLDRE